MSDETYIGDGLYASFDGENIVLCAPRSEGDALVYLDTETYQSLLRFVEAVNKGAINVG